jgi:hypothetical protein
LAAAIGSTQDQASDAQAIGANAPGHMIRINPGNLFVALVDLQLQFAATGLAGLAAAGNRLRNRVNGFLTATSFRQPE